MYNCLGQAATQYKLSSAVGLIIIHLSLGNVATLRAVIFSKQMKRKFVESSDG